MVRRTPVPVCFIVPVALPVANPKTNATKPPQKPTAVFFFRADERVVDTKKSA
jgi:hypothetical protein